MNPTDEERREAAESPRNLDACRIRYAEQFYKELMNSWDFDGFQDLACRLADLIEPAPERTCRDLGGEDGTNFEHYDFGCSECGFAADVAEPNYCPNCGAKVVGR